jgi:hypothetical protein
MIIGLNIMNRQDLEIKKMSFSSFKKEKLLFENWRQHLKEQASDEDTIGRLRTAIEASQPDDVLELKFLKDVPVELGAGVEVKAFLKGKSYTARVDNDGKIAIQHEPIMAKTVDIQTKEKFIESIEKQAKENNSPPCTILNCEKSTVTRGRKTVKMIEFLKNPNVFTAAAETEAEPTPEPTPETAPVPAAEAPTPESPKEPLTVENLEARVSALREKFTAIGQLQTQLQTMLQARSPK